MNNFQQLKLSTRLILCFGIVLLMSVVSSGFAIWKLEKIQAVLDDIVNDNVVKIEINHEFSDAVHVVARVMRTLMLVRDEEVRKVEQVKLAQARAAYDKARAALDRFPPSEEGRALRLAIDGARDKARPINDQVLALDLAGQEQQAVDLLIKTANPALVAWQEAIERNVEFQGRNNAQEYAEAQAAEVAARNLLLGFALASLAISVGLVSVLVRGIVGQIGGEPADVVALATHIANADLSNRVAVRPGDSHSVVAAMARMQQQLVGIVASVRGNAEGVATASMQIAQGTQDLSSRTEEQASALEQTAATMEQLGATVRTNTDSARQANQLAQGASQVAARGGEVVGAVVATMKAINDSSRRIADINAVIDGIAFQTNILALNAAVEAARAGEQGRGFAVVASEVRNLARRSAEAAREIKSLIAVSVERVEQGSAQVDQAGQTMTELVGAIQRVTDIVGEIASASVEQSSGVSQVGEAVGQMDQATQQNAALVEESAAASESLKLQAELLVQTVAVFKLADAPPTAPRATVRPAPLPRPTPSRTAPTAGFVASARVAPGATRAMAAASDADWAAF